MTNIERLAAFAATTEWEDLPSITQGHLVALIRDAITVAAAGDAAPGCPELLSLAAEWVVPQGASVVYRDMVLPPPQAAMINATLCEAWDYDDTHDRGIVHALAPILWSVLAVAEWARHPVSGPEMLAACAVGVEILCRLGVASQTPLTWTRTTTLGGMAGAAAAGRVLRLDRDAIHNAMGIAYTQASGNSQTIADAATSKKMQVGFAARAAVLSTMLASRKITGPRDILEGEHGYFRLYEPNAESLDGALADLGDSWEIDEVAIKPFPCARDNHAALAAVLDATRGERLSPDTVDRVEVRTSQLVENIAGRPVTVSGPRATIAAILSIPYTVAVMLESGTLRLLDLTEERIVDPSRQRLQSRVDVKVDPAIAANNLAPVFVTIHLKNGTTLEGSCHTIPGTRTWMEENAALLDLKREDCISMAESEQAARRLTAADAVLGAANDDRNLAAHLVAALTG